MAQLLYHRTDAQSAAEIVRTRTWRSRENPPYVFFSNRRAGQAQGYGGTMLSVRVPEEYVELDDEFPSGEQHVRVLTTHLRGLPVRVVGAKR